MSQHPAKCSSHWGGECDCDFPLLEATDHLRAAADMLMKTCPSCEELEREVSRLRADGQRLRDLLGESAERINRARLTLGVAERTEELWLQARRETAEAEVLIRIALEKDAP